MHFVNVRNTDKSTCLLPPSEDLPKAITVPEPPVMLRVSENINNALIVRIL